MKPILDTAISLSLGYLCAGTLVWCFLVNTGVVRNSYLARCEREASIGRTRRKIVFGTFVCIVAWPKAVPVLWRKAKWKAKGWHLAFWRGDRF